jgi:diaminopimelate epimerase
MVPPGEFCLLTDAGTVWVRSSAEDAAEIKVPDFDAPRPFSEVPLAAGERWMSFVIVGVPHLVVRVDDVEVVDPDNRGRHLRFQPSLGGNGANVNFVSPAGAEGAWLIRTYERGVEAETLACGTGTVAAAAAVAYRGECSLPMTFRSRGGPKLRVRAQPAPGRVSDAWLSGQGLLLFRGLWEAG